MEPVGETLLACSVDALRSHNCSYRLRVVLNERSSALGGRDLVARAILGLTNAAKCCLKGRVFDYL
jgi:hypothetical protein